MGLLSEVTELATKLSISCPTLDRYLDLLEQTFVIFRLSSFSTNPPKEIAKGRKLFLWGTAIPNAMLGVFTTEALRSDIAAL